MKQSSTKLLTLAFCIIAMSVVAREKTAHTSTLLPKHENAMVENITQNNVEEDSNSMFRHNALSIKGYDKRVSDSRETFFVTNNTEHPLSLIKLQFQYSDLGGKMLHQRFCDIPCDIPAGETRQLSVTSFDRQRAFYYYLSPKPKKHATPFKVAYKLLRYDIKIEP